MSFQYFAHSPFTSWRTVGDFTLVVDHSTGTLITLADVGSQVWNALSDWTTTGNVVRKITQEFDVDPETAKQDASDFISDLRAARLILSSQNSPTAEPSRTFSSPRTNGDYRSQLPVDVRSYCQRNNIPLIGFIELTEKCNLRCVHCYNSRAKGKELTSSEIFSILDEFADLGVLDLVLTGGEPTALPYFSDILSYAKAKRFCITVKSNGTLIQHEIARTMAETLVVEAQLSLYSMDPEVHDSITTHPGSHAHTLLGIEALRDEGIAVRISCPVTNLNYRSIEAVKAFSDSIGAACGFDPIISPKTDSTLSPLNLRLGPQEWRYLLDTGVISRTLSPNTSNVNDLVPNPESDAQALNEPFCGAGTTSLAISSHGDVRPCVIFPASMGNIRARSLKEIWHDDDAWSVVRRFRKNHFTSCSGCELENTCLRCPAVSLSESGSVSKPSPFFCDTSKYYRDSALASRLT